jgi:hypothetical protein
MFVPAAFAELETETSVGERAHFLGGIGFLHVTRENNFAKFLPNARRN